MLSCKPIIIVGRGGKEGDAFRVFHDGNVNTCIMLALLSEGNGNRKLVINYISSRKPSTVIKRVRVLRSV